MTTRLMSPAMASICNGSPCSFPVFVWLVLLMGSPLETASGSFHVFGYIMSREGIGLVCHLESSRALGAYEHLAVVRELFGGPRDGRQI